MGQHKNKTQRRIVRKATKKQKKALYDNKIAVQHAFLVELYNMKFRDRLGAAWDILIKGKGK